ncbi:hypothetical protein HMF7854_13395 [Sphingomonas ginkgonis]|uniref:histidine kinase n=1 Tax=Sphingomonas ginkgonis TaxID=2315330 RepID=A0A429VCR0_9SPHN|nr:ATP-binding protein [Sphingomonas ginkgonis]RST31723.1 hypothetical protein HMF7854_13395 [Sphingomonas ginkgonis]
MRLVPRSLFGRLVVVQAVVALLLAGALPLLTSRLLSSTVNSFVGRELDRSAERIAPNLRLENGRWSFRRGFEPPSFFAPNGIRRFDVIDGDRRILFSGGPRYGIDFRELPLEASHAHRLANGIDIATYPLPQGGSGEWLVISSDRRRPEELVARLATAFLTRFLWIVPAFVIASLLLSLLLFARATRSIRRASSDADLVDANRLDVRLDWQRLPREVQPLAEAVNSALDRVHDAFEAQTEFVANVAHELRTPLATIACRAEEVTDLELRERLLASVSHAAHVIEQVMRLARLASSDDVNSRVDLRALALASVEHSAGRVFTNGRSIAFHDEEEGRPVVARGIAGLAQLSLDNLIDNAQRHTPTGTSIVVHLGPGPTLRVEDDGPGIAVSDRNRVQRRHWRADDRRSDSAGLGLSIVDRAMVAQAGRLEVGESALGGAAMTLRFEEPA